jgi:plastocyanin
MHRSSAVLLGFLAAAIVSMRAAADWPRTTNGPGTEDFTITARREPFTPARIEVARGDIVKITLIAEDMPHTFTIDSYRISKRASPGQNVTIESLYGGRCAA